MLKISPSSFPIKAIHSTPVWLPQTMTWLCNQVRYLPDDIESHIVCGDTENLDQFNVPNIQVLPELSLLSRFGESGLKGAKPLSRMLWLWRMCRRIKPDIVHSHFGNVGWFDSLVVRLTKSKHVVTFYGMDVTMVPEQDRRWLGRYKSLFKSANLFLCEGSHMAECLIKLGCPPDKVKVHHLGVEIDKIPYRPRRWQPGEILCVLIAATFREKKGIPYALEALGMVQHEMPLKITIIGDATHESRSQSEKQKIFQVIEKYGLQSKIRMLGFQPYSVLMEQAYKHHIFISPSVTAEDGDTEGGVPVSIIETSASGMPILSTTHCDIPEVVIDGESGYLVPERDVDALADKLDFLVSNPAIWGKMGQNGREHIEKNYNIKEQARRLEQTYDEVTRGYRKHE